MNTLAIDKNSGLYYTQNDLRWMQLGLSAAIANGSYLNGQNSFIIKDAQAIDTGTFVEASPGIVCFNGEVCLFDGLASVTKVPGTNLYWQILTTYDSTGLKNFVAGPPQNMYQINKVQLVQAASAPAGAIANSAMPREEALLAAAISTQQINFSNTVSFYVGGTVSITAGVMGIGTGPNICGAYIAANDTLTGFNIGSASYPSGTLLYVNFSGSAGNQVSVTPGSGITTPGGRVYIYRAGDWAVFVSQGGGNFALVEKDTKGPWQVPTVFLNSWVSTAAPFRFRKSADGRVSMDGTLTKTVYTSASELVYTLPAGYRPAYGQEFFFSLGTVSIDTSGNVYVYVNGISASLAEMWFCGITFATD